MFLFKKLLLEAFELGLFPNPLETHMHPSTRNWEK
jgi:hypothetical protein